MPQTYEEFVQSMVPGIGMASGAPGRATLMSGTQMVDMPEAQAKQAYATLQAKREEALKKAYRDQADAWIQKSMVDTLASMGEQEVKTQLARTQVMQAIDEQARQRRFQSLMAQGVQEGKEPRQAYIDAAMSTLPPEKSAAFLRGTAPVTEDEMGNPQVTPIEGTGMSTVLVPGSKRWSVVKTGQAPGSLSDAQKAEIASRMQGLKSMDVMIQQAAKKAHGYTGEKKDLDQLATLQTERAKMAKDLQSIYRTVSSGPTGAPAPDSEEEVEMVLVFDPTGKQGKIPKANLKGALENGFRLR